MREQLRQTLWPKGPRPDIWAIVDPAQDQKVYWTLTNSFLRHSCLFAGPLPQALEMAAPYLVQLDSEDKFTSFLADNLGRSLGIFLQCDTTLEVLRRHLRTILRVKDTHGRRLLFRYYDPRVMRVYLPTCSSSELDAVFGPVNAIWTEGQTANDFTQFMRKGKQLVVTPQPLGAGAGEGGGEMLAPAIVAAQSLLVLRKTEGARQRVPVLLQSAGRGGRLSVSSRGIRIYRTAAAADEMPMANGAYVIPGTSLEPDVTVYAEPVAACEATLTLELLQGGKVEGKLMAVALTLDGGSPEIHVGVRGRGAGNRRRIDVHPVEPASFRGRLQLRAAPGGPALTLYTSADSAAGYDLNDGFSFDAPAATASFWLEGATVSTQANDATIQLYVDGVAAAGDARPVTAVEFAPMAPRPLVLLSGSLDEANPFSLQASAEPAGVPLRWEVTRADDDGPAITALSINPVPALQPNGDAAALQSDAAGTFLVSASAGSAKGWGGPMETLEVTLVHAAAGENGSSINGRFCACERESGTDRFRLHSGKEPAVRLAASVRLTGGGPGGQRGLEAVRGGWVNNILSDNAGARYKGGREAVTRIEEGPLLEMGEAGSPCMPGSTPSGPMGAHAGEPVWISAVAAPELARPVYENGALEHPIEQIWRYLDCCSFLAVWTVDAPEHMGVLARTGWSFTGDYMCNVSRTVRPIVPARLAPTGTAGFPALTPSAKAGLETRRTE